MSYRLGNESEGVVGYLTIDPDSGYFFEFPPENEVAEFATVGDLVAAIAYFAHETGEVPSEKIRQGFFIEKNGERV